MQKAYGASLDAWKAARNILLDKTYQAIFTNDQMKQWEYKDAPLTAPSSIRAKPILFIFGYITTISVIAARSANGFNGTLAMRVFVSGFFLTFSFLNARSAGIR